MICHPNNLPRMEGRLEAMVVWMSEKPLRPMDDFVVKHSTQQVTGAGHPLAVSHRREHPSIGRSPMG